MQTFLPYSCFQRSAMCLDRQRLGKQRVECKQIIIANLTGPYRWWNKNQRMALNPAQYGPPDEDNPTAPFLGFEWKPTPWYNHPAVKMWRGYTKALTYYATYICQEWRARGYKENLLPFFTKWWIPGIVYDVPPWLGCENFHSSHRARLLFKDPEWYGKFGWTETPRSDKDGYIWPK